MIVKRPGRSKRRRSNKKHRLLNEEYVIKIQRFFRSFLKRRYIHKVPNNYDDVDNIDMEEVYMIPKYLLISLDGTGYNALSLLKWLSKNDKDPVRRVQVDYIIPCNCIDGIELYKNKTKFITKKSGYFKNRRKCSKIIEKYRKSQRIKLR